MFPPVQPILIAIGPLSIHWYGVIMTLAIFLGALVASRFVAKHGEDGNAIWDMLLWILIPALIGARLYFVFVQSPRGPDGLGAYLANPMQILEIWNGGIHIYGALIFGGIALLLYLRIHKLPFGRYLDGVALGMTLGQAIGRLGNFINQELYGPPTTLPWGLRIDEAHRIPPYNDLTLYPANTLFQPLFLYEMIWDAIGFVLLLWIARRFAKQLRSGDIFCLYLIWVPFGRFFLEFMRTDSWFFPGTPFNTAHILTATAVICGLTFLILRHRQAPTLQPALEPQGDEVAPEILVEDDQKALEVFAEPAHGTVDSSDISEDSDVARDTLVEGNQEALEVPVESMQDTKAPDTSEPSEALLETVDDPDRVVTVSSAVDGTIGTVSATDSIEIEHP